MIKRLFVPMMMVLACNAQAYDLKKCFAFQTKRALFRKYDLKYLAPTTHPSDSVNCSIPTDTTTKEGLSKYSTQNSIQGSTISVDPGVTTNSSTGSTQFSSSFGECSMLGYQMDERRDAFVASNWQALREEIAMGDGDHLAALIMLLNCRDAAYSDFVTQLRARYDLLTGPQELLHELDGLIKNQASLRKACSGSSVRLAQTL